MKKETLISICILALLLLSSCRSTSSSCGLADNTSNNTNTELVNIV